MRTSNALLPRALLIVLVSALLTGCGEEITGPPLALEPAVTPATVCNASNPENAALQTRVVLRPTPGNSFAPLPVDLLTPDASLAIPRVVLRAEGGAEVTVRQVEFVSPREMALWVSATTSNGGPLTPGRYTVTITNPDGQRGNTMAAALRVTPPPTLSSVTRIDPVVPAMGVDADEAQTICNGFTSVLSVVGTNFRPEDPVPVVEVVGPSGNTVRRVPEMDVRVMSPTEIRVTLRAATDPALRLATGRYGLRVTNPDGAAGTYLAGADAGTGAHDGGVGSNPGYPQGCRATNPSLFNVVPPPEVRAVEPVSACSSRDRSFVVRGAFFRRGITVTVNAPTPFTVPLANVQYASSTGSTNSFDTLTINVPAGSVAPGGPFAVGLRNADACAVTLEPACPAGTQGTGAPNECQGMVGMSAGTGPRALTFYPDPVVTSVMPRGLCTARLMPVTITGMNFHATYGVQPRVEIRGVALENVRVLSTTSLSADIPMSLMAGMPLGAAFDVTVTVPEGCAGSLPGGFTLFPPPTVTAVRPGSVCVDRPGTTLTITGTNFHTFEGRGPTVSLGATTPVELTNVRVNSPTEITAMLPGNTPGGGPYDLTVTTPVGCPAVLPRAFTYHLAPTITGASAQASCTGGNPVLLITGTNFHETAGQLPTVRLNTATPVNLTGVRVTAPTTILAELPATLPMGSYTVDVTMPEGCGATSMAFAYNPGSLITPTLAGMIPSRGWNGIDMPVIIQGTGLASLTGLALRGAGPSGGDLALTDLSIVGGDLINATIPAGGRAGGPYELFSTVSGCPITLPRAYTITDTPAITVSSVTPPFGWTGGTTPIVLRGTGFASTPRLFLVVPALTPRMRQLSRPVFIDATQVSAVVPAGLPPGTYDLAAINPDGGGGLLRMAFRVTMRPPPSIRTVIPGAGTTQSSTTVTITGENFRSPAVQLRASGGATFDGTVTGSTANAVTVSLPTNRMTPGAYVVRVTNPDEGTFADFGSFVVTNPAVKLGPFSAGTSLTVGRRGAAAVAGRVTAVNRFVYALGGDTGAGGMVHDTVEFAPVDLFGRLGAWRVQRNRLPAGRAAIANAAVEREGSIYIVGGADGTGAPVDTVLHARVLDFSTAPVIDEPEITRVRAGGLAPGAWLYRVSAVMAPSDRDNPGGETLPSDEVTAYFVFASTVRLRWAPVMGAASYRVYRAPMVNGTSGSETLLTTVTATTNYVDDGTATPMAASPATQPLLVGSTGVWRATGTLRTPRAGTAVALATDPGGDAYLYALTGRGPGGPLASYEYVRLPEGGATLGMFTTGPTPFPTARELGAAAVASAETASQVTAGTFVYVTGGFNATGSLRATESGRVGAGGALLGVADTNSYALRRGGLGAMIVNGEFYAMGGTSGMNPGSNALDTTNLATLATSGVPGAFSNASNSMLTARSQFGLTLSSAFFFLVGGTRSGTDALTSVEQTIY